LGIGVPNQEPTHGDLTALSVNNVAENAYFLGQGEQRTRTSVVAPELLIPGFDKRPYFPVRRLDGVHCTSSKRL
jgi:hypothetical protein